MRYLIDDSYFMNTTDGKLRPILFYAGNEGDIYQFYQNSGFMTTTLAEKWGGLVVFGEHRYFGESMPFGDQSLKKRHLSKLTPEQAMLDYVELIKMLK